MKNLCLQVFLFCTCAFADIPYYPGLHGNSLIEDDVKLKLLPHLLPLDHPLKSRLDLIFSQSRVTESLESMKHAGFTILYCMSRSFAVIAKHPFIPGYIFKMHLDSEKYGRDKMDSTHWLINRCIGAKKIQEIIDKKQIRYFVVPDKWLYLLPLYPSSAKPNPRPVILIAKEIPIANRTLTEKAWRSEATKGHLKELYSILKTGYGSYALLTNVPYVGNGIFAFIDTETLVPQKKLKMVGKHLSSPMQKYWMHLID